MATVELRLYFDEEAADADTLARFTEIHVDQAIGMAAEAQLHMDLIVDEKGYWDGMGEELTQAGVRVRIEVKIGDHGYVPLIDGSIVGSRFELSADAESSTMVLIVQDDSALLNVDETVTLFEDKRADEIATQLFEEFGLQADVDETPDAGSALARCTVQRGTAMQLLRDLARRHGMFVYVTPGAKPSKSIGVFKYPTLEKSDLPELLLLGAERNVARFSAEFDATRPLKAAAYSVGVTDKAVIGSTGEDPDVDALGDERTHEVVTPARTLLARTREEQSDLDEAVTAAVNASSFAYSASAEVVADSYEGVLLPYRVVSVAGVGANLSGDYLVARVTHVLTDDSYKQQVELKRNARSAEAGAGAGAPGGIF